MFELGVFPTQIPPLELDVVYSNRYDHSKLHLLHEYTHFREKSGDFLGLGVTREVGASIRIAINTLELWDSTHFL